MTDFDAPLHDLPDPLPIPRLAAPFDVTIRPPGSKSITNRAYLLAALADGESRITRPLRSHDCDLLLDALRTLGVGVRWDHDDVCVRGVSGRFPAGGTVDLGDGGTPTRFMIAAACLAAAPVVVDGSPRMRERPVAEGVDLLRGLGAHLEYVESDGRLPVRITPSASFAGGSIEVGRTASSQFVSAVMLVAPWLRDGVRVRYTDDPTSASYLELTRDVLRRWGVEVERGDRADVVRPRAVRGRRFDVEPDASSQAYFAAATAVIAGARATLPGIPKDSVQPDRRVLDHLATMGLRIDDAAEGDGVRCAAPRRPGPLRADLSLAPDGALALAAACAMADGVSELSGLRTLRVKETDRIAALATELRRIGCAAEATDDAITIDPSSRHAVPAVIETYNDHRMAMAFAVLGLARGGLAIADPACVAKSYPTFWRDFGAMLAPPGRGS